MEHLILALVILVVVDTGLSVWSIITRRKAAKISDAMMFKVAQTMGTMTKIMTLLPSPEDMASRVTDEITRSVKAREPDIAAKILDEMMPSEVRTLKAVHRIAKNSDLTGEQKFAFVARMLIRRYPEVTERDRARLIEDAVKMMKESGHRD